MLGKRGVTFVVGMFLEWLFLGGVDGVQMNIISYIVQGLGGWEKRRDVLNLVKKQ